jgi:hypothetical protein
VAFTRINGIIGLIAMSVVLTGTVLGQSGGGSIDLDKLSRPHEGRTMRVSSADPDWRSGNEDYRPIKPGETLTMADVEGPGVIRHIWFTINALDPQYGRSVVLRMYWDGHDEPAVEAPLGDFFAVGHGVLRNVDSLPVAVTSEGRSYTCYWSMPFAKRARITLTNDSPTHRVRSLYWYIDYEQVPSLPPDTLYFHAQYRQEYPATPEQNYLILDTEGRGNYVGTVLSVYSRTRGWFGEGDDFFYIDGEAEPSLRGTGTEDYFCDAWGFREFNRPYFGVVLFEGYEFGDRVCAYRWHIPDPIRFSKSLKFEFEHAGVMFDDKGKRISGFHDRADLFSSVAFWYQDGKAKRFAELPPVAQRVVPATRVEMEGLLDSAKATPAETMLELGRSSLFSGGSQLVARFSEGNGRLTVPFVVAEDVQGIARLRLGTSSDSGTWSVALNEQSPFVVDLYSPALAARELRLGAVDLKTGEHVLTFECRGGNPASSGYVLGVDVLNIEDVTPYAVPAAE